MKNLFMTFRSVHIVDAVITKTSTIPRCIYDSISVIYVSNDRDQRISLETIIFYKCLVLSTFVNVAIFWHFLAVGNFHFFSLEGVL